MRTKLLKAFFAFSRQQQNGIFFLLFCIVMLQCIYFFADLTPKKAPDHNSETWIAFQHTIDSLKQLEAENRKPKVYPFNPNYITDHKAYTLGMSVVETDRLLAYRKNGKFVNSAAEFQQITRVSDSLLKAIAPYFKFPDWVNTKKKPAKTKTKARPGVVAVKSPPDLQKDLNTVTVQELKAIRGIGDVLSARIVKFRDRLNGFLTDEQLYDVYGLSAEIADKVLQSYTVFSPPQVRKIDVNTATVASLSSIVYIRYKAAEAIIRHRDSVGKIQSLEELTKIPYLPIDKIDRIELYLKVE